MTLPSKLRQGATAMVQEIHAVVGDALDRYHDILEKYQYLFASGALNAFEEREYQRVLRGMGIHEALLHVLASGASASSRAAIVLPYSRFIQDSEWTLHLFDFTNAFIYLMSTFLIGEPRDGPVEAVAAKAPVLFRRLFYILEGGEDQLSQWNYTLIHSRIILLAAIIIEHHPQPKAMQALTSSSSECFIDCPHPLTESLLWTVRSLLAGPCSWSSTPAAT